MKPTSVSPSRSAAPERGGSPASVAPNQRAWLLVAVGIGTAMPALDTSVVNTVLPVITRVLNSDVATLEWVVTTYLLVVSGLLLTFGRLGDLRGHKAIYVGGFFVFILGSALCGLAPGAGFLIAARTVQGLGAAMLFANAPAILTKGFPASERGKALGIQATMTYVGLTAGPFLGGWLTQQLGWRSVFFINIPFGLAGMLLSLRCVPRDEPGSKGERFDVPGALLFMAGFVVLLFALNRGHAWGWGSPLLLSLFVLAAVLLVVFVAVERRVAQPMLDLSLFASRAFSVAVGTAILTYLCIYSVIFLLPFYLIQGRGLDPASAGLILTAQPLVMALTASFSGALSDRIGVRIPATVGMAVQAVGLFLLSRLGPGAPVAAVVGSLAVAGLGVGIFTSPNNSAMMGAAPTKRQGIASGILGTARTVGMVLGVGVVGAIFTTVLAHGLAAGEGGSVFAGVSAALLVAAGIAAAGVAASWTRSA